jgi:hypothetical protein
MDERRELQRSLARPGPLVLAPLTRAPRRHVLLRARPEVSGPSETSDSVINTFQSFPQTCFSHFSHTS